MAEIYSVPKDIEVPNIFELSATAYTLAVDNYIEIVKSRLKPSAPEEEHLGKVLRLSHGDGYALYMIFTVEPVQLVHLPLGDGYNFPYIENFTSKNVLDRLLQQEKLEELFGKG